MNAPSSSLFFGATVTLLTFFIGFFLQKKTGFALLNPFIVSFVLTCSTMLIFKIDFDFYFNSAQTISFLLTPTTVCLMLPLYRNRKILAKNAVAVFVSITAGVIISALSIFAIAYIFSLDNAAYATLLPKSITTAIGEGLSAEMGGIPEITVAGIILTGIFGFVASNFTFKIFGIKSAFARGLALGSSAHGLGTAKAFEMGEVEGAMSSLSVAICGITTVISAQFFILLIE